MQAEGGSVSEELKAMVETAVQHHEYRRRVTDKTLLRIDANGCVERLVDGLWVKARRPRALDNQTRWERMGARELGLHARRFLVENLAAEGIGWRGSTFRARVRRGAVARWINPPPHGGAVQFSLDPPAVRRTEGIYMRQLRRAGGDDLERLSEQAITGTQQQRERSARIDQRANFFLGASGLTTSLVLANAGLLLGTGKLEPPWLQSAACALGIASFCAVVAGYRAMQATMSTLSRPSPNSAPLVTRRAKMSGDELTRAHMAALFVAENRERSFSDWKLVRLSEARRWFVGVILGVVVLTVVVLGAALDAA